MIPPPDHALVPPESRSREFPSPDSLALPRRFAGADPRLADVEANPAYIRLALRERDPAPETVRFRRDRLLIAIGCAGVLCASLFFPEQARSGLRILASFGFLVARFRPGEIVRREPVPGLGREDLIELRAAGCAPREIAIALWARGLRKFALRVPEVAAFAWFAAGLPFAVAAAASEGIACRCLFGILAAAAALEAGTIFAHRRLPPASFAACEDGLLAVRLVEDPGREPVAVLRPGAARPLARPSSILLPPIATPFLAAAPWPLALPLLAAIAALAWRIAMEADDPGDGEAAIARAARVVEDATNACAASTP